MKTAKTDFADPFQFESRRPSGLPAGRWGSVMFLVSGLLLIVACSGSGIIRQAGPGQSSEGNSGESFQTTESGKESVRKDQVKEGLYTLYGTLIRREYPPRSVEAYSGAEFFLHDPHYFSSGIPFVIDRIVLQPSDKVSREDLLSRDHEFVTVTVIKVEGTLPDPRSSYPVNPDGSPVRQGGGWQVLQILPGP